MENDPHAYQISIKKDSLVHIAMGSRYSMLAPMLTMTSTRSTHDFGDATCATTLLASCPEKSMASASSVTYLLVANQQLEL